MKNELDEKDREALQILQEECAEIIQAVSKIFRFGLTNTWNGRTARQDLEDEIGDLNALLSIIHARGITREREIEDAQLRKIQKLRKWSSLFDDEVEK